MKKVYTIPVTILLSIDAENERQMEEVLKEMQCIFKHEESQIEMLRCQWNPNKIQRYY